MRVLVVDDYQDTRELLCTLLQPQAATVAVGRGLQALLQYHTALSMGEPFTAIVLDGALPDIPGAVVAKIIRQLEIFASSVPRTRLVYYSGHASLLTQAQREQCQFDAEIDKPGDPEQLVRLITATSTDC